MANASIRLATPLQQDSIVDGPGVRMVLWTQGCIHHCPGCHNPQTWNDKAGTLYNIEELCQQIQEAQLQSGLTLSGGEPFLQSEELLPIVKTAKKKGLNIWAYTGFTFDELLKDPNKRAVLAYLDVLVDGKFIEAKKDYRLVFKGSSNQRIIDVQDSLKQNKILYSSYDEKNHIE